MQQQPAQQQQQQQQQVGGSGISIVKMIGMYFLVNWIFGFFKKPSPSVSYMNVLYDGEPINLLVKINTTQGDWIWEENDLLYSTSEERAFNFTVSQEELQNNPYIRAFVQVISKETDKMIINSFPLCELRHVQKEELKNLLFDNQEEFGIKAAVKKEEGEKEWHIIQAAYINLIHDTNGYPYNQIPPQLMGSQLQYTPNLDADNFRLRKKHYTAIKEQEQFDIPLQFNVYWVWKYLMVASIKDSNKVYAQFGMEGMMDEAAQDQIKEMIYETNIYLVSVTMVVSVLHSIFSTLAFKNGKVISQKNQFEQTFSIGREWSLMKEYQFEHCIPNSQLMQKQKKLNILFVQIIILLYCLDNETSFIILVEMVLGMALTVWKILKTSKFKRRADQKFPYFELIQNSSYKSKTLEHDQYASKVLYISLIPLLICYLIYSLIYEEHKGFYSFILTSLVGFIYVFGFINMTPQLYINYKLKSVAHISSKAMIFRFLNTIIDDLFAFIITMPLLRRLSCFRDGIFIIFSYSHLDIIFLIYLYQRRIYKIDSNRYDMGDGLDRKKPTDEANKEEQKVIEESKETEKKAELREESKEEAKSIELTKPEETKETGRSNESQKLKQE